MLIVNSQRVPRAFRPWGIHGLCTNRTGESHALSLVSKLSRAPGGVITTEPGFTLGNDPEEMEDVDKVTSRPMLALMGRVPVKATTENGPIRPGDLLTVANKPGYAMRCAEAEECEGAILGKALAGLQTGEGLILVLVMSP